MIRINHIINPYAAQKGSENFTAQPICQESAVRARDAATGVAQVNLLAIWMQGEAVEVNEGFTQVPSLQRSIVDFIGSAGKRKLPLLHDVLQAAYNHSECDYIVYTNADIAVMPGFYKMIAHYAGKGYDGFSINRRRISGRFTSVNELEQAYAEAGETHTGYDTIVFKRSLFPKFRLNNVSIGIPYFDTVLVHNLYAHCEQYRLFTGKHLTFHIGMELVKEWGSKEEYRHNRVELRKTIAELYPLFRIENFPGAALPFFTRHFKWLMNPTFHYPTMFRLDLSQLSHPRRKYPEEKTISGQRTYNWLVKKVNFPDEE